VIGWLRSGDDGCERILQWVGGWPRRMNHSGRRSGGRPQVLG